MAKKVKNKDGGKLRIGDDWNAIRIIALSQSNPLKAIAEFVENSIDAQAKNITITRGREHGAHYLSIKDDGNGVPRDVDGLPDFKYVATHICDSIKRHLEAEGNGTGVQGEFGIGLLSFWRVDTLRKFYGDNFAAGYRSDTKLGTVLRKEGVDTLDQLLKKRRRAS